MLWRNIPSLVVLVMPHATCHMRYECFTEPFHRAISPSVSLEDQEITFHHISSPATGETHISAIS